MSTSREEFLARVRRPLGDRSVVDEPPTIPEFVRRVADEDDLVERFAAQAQTIGVQVHLVSAAGVPGKIAQLVGECKIQTLTAGLEDDPLAEARQAFIDAGCVVVPHADAPGLDAHYDVDAGLTSVRFGVAETGSLAVASGANHSRGEHFVPPIHIALLRPDQIVADLIDCWELLRRAGPLPASTVLISGPSKTADIEGVLVVGAHGPVQVHVLLISPP